MLLNIEFKFYWYKDVNRRRTRTPCWIREAIELRRLHSSTEWASFDAIIPSLQLMQSKRRTVVESGKRYTCILQYFLQIWPAALVGEVPGLVEVLGVVECTEEIFSLGWRFNTEIGSAHLPGCCMPSPGKIFHRTSVAVPCTQFHVLNQKYF